MNNNKAQAIQELQNNGLSESEANMFMGLVDKLRPGYEKTQEFYSIHSDANITFGQSIVAIKESLLND